MIHGFAFRFAAASWNTFNTWHVVCFRAPSSGHKSGMIHGTKNIALKRYKPSRNWMKRRSRVMYRSWSDGEIVINVWRWEIMKWCNEHEWIFELSLLIYQLDEIYFLIDSLMTISWKNRYDSLFYAVVLRGTSVPRSPEVLAKFTRTYVTTREENPFRKWKMEISFLLSLFSFLCPVRCEHSEICRKCKNPMSLNPHPSKWSNEFYFTYRSSCFVLFRPAKCTDAWVIFNSTSIHRWRNEELYII